MDDERRPYMRMKRENHYHLRVDICHRDGSEGGSILVKSGSLEQGIQFLFTTEPGTHAFFVVPETNEERAHA